MHAINRRTAGVTNERAEYEAENAIPQALFLYGLNITDCPSRSPAQLHILDLGGAEPLPLDDILGLDALYHAN